MLAQLGALATRRQDFTAAEQRLDEASALFQRPMGEDVPGWVTVLRAQLRLKQGRVDEAEALVARVVPVGNELTQVLNTLADVRIQQGRHAEAAALRHQVLEEYRRKFGEHSRWVRRQTELLAATSGAPASGH